MTTLTNTAEGTSGSAAPANSIGAPNALDTRTLAGTGAALDFDSTVAHTGNTSLRHTLPGGVAASSYTDWKASITTPASNSYARFYLYLTAYPTVTTRIVAMLSGTSLAASVQLTTTGTFRTVNSAGTVLATSTGTIPLNQWVRVEFEVTGISGSTGTVACRTYSGANLEGSTPDTGCSLSTAGASVFGTVTDVRYAHSSSVTMTTTWQTWYDDYAWSDTAQPGPMGGTSQVTGSRTTTWTTQARVTGTRGTTWTAKGRVTGTRSTSWSVYRQIVYVGTGGVWSQSVADTITAIPLPTMQDGDYCVVALSNGAATAPTAPAGWTLLAGSASGGTQNPYLSVFGKFCTAAESGTTLNINKPSGTANGIAVAFRYVDSATPVDAAPSVLTTAATTAYDVPAITTATVSDAFVGFATANFGGTWTPPTNLPFVEVADAGSPVPGFTADYAISNLAAGVGTGVFNYVRSSGSRGAAIVVPLRSAGSTSAQVTGTRSTTWSVSSTVPVTGTRATSWAVSDPVVKVAVVADMQPGAGVNPPPSVVAAKVVAWDPRYVFMPGDLANDGTTAQYGYFNTMYGSLKSRIYPVPGNHDWGNTAGNSLTPYSTYWSGQNAAAGGNHAYSFDITVGTTTWHIIAFDSDNSTNGSVLGTGLPAPSAGTALYNWIAADIAANPGKPLIAFCHHPRWSDGTATGIGGTNDDTTLTDIWNLLYDNHADLVLTGHCHSYQRFPKLGKTGVPDVAGIREIVVGTGGSGLHTLSATRRSTVSSYQSTAYDQLNSEWFGYLRLTLSPTSYSWSFVSQDGTTILDSGSDTPNLNSLAVTATRSTTWTAKAQVSGTRATTWNVLSGLVRVTGTRATTWTVKQVVTRLAATTWNTLSNLVQVTGSRTTTWSLSARVTGSRSTNWRVTPLIFVFRPPTYEAPMLTSVEPLRHYRLTQGISVVRVNGVFRSVRAPSSDQLTAAGTNGVDYFIGGCEYVVTKDIRDELIAAGYTID